MSYIWLINCNIVPYVRFFLTLCSHSRKRYQEKKTRYMQCKYMEQSQEWRGKNSL